MTFWNRLRRRRKQKGNSHPDIAPPSTEALDAALAFLDDATVDVDKHNRERAAELKEIQGDLEQDALDTQSLIRRLESQS